MVILHKKEKRKLNLAYQLKEFLPKRNGGTHYNLSFILNLLITALKYSVGFMNSYFLQQVSFYWDSKNSENVLK